MNSFHYIDVHVFLQLITNINVKFYKIEFSAKFCANRGFSQGDYVTLAHIDAPASGHILFFTGWLENTLARNRNRVFRLPNQIRTRDGDTVIRNKNPSRR
jgi:hypothetical protein